MDRSTKTFIAVFTLVAALILTVNHVIQEAPLADYGLAALLFLISFGFWAWIWVESQEDDSETALTVSEDASSLREWTIADDVDVPEPVPTYAPPPAAKVAEPDVEEEPVAEAESEPEPAEEAEPEPQPEPVAEETPAEEAAAEQAPPEAEPEPEPEPEPVAKEEPAQETEAEPVAEEASAEQEVAKEPAPAASSDTPDDLERIEGIGQKYKDALVAEGIDSFEKLAALSLEEIEQAAQKQGMRRRASMKTWAEQATLAAKGDWDGLDALQEALTGGRRS